MLGAALLAKNAVERGLTVKPWVKTSMAPGSKVVTDYYEKAGLWPYLEKLGYHLVGYGCTTCIGNSGPLSDEISAAVNEADLAVVSVLSGQPELRGPDQPGRQDELPGLPAAGDRLRARRHDGLRLRDPAAGHRTPTATTVYLRDIWPTAQDVQDDDRQLDQRGDVHQGLRRRLRRRRALALAAHAGGQRRSSGTRTRPTCASPRTSRACSPSPSPVDDISGARVLALLGDSVTTDHISPAGSIKADTPAGQYLVEHGVDKQRLQLLRLPARQPRGDDPRHVRQHPAAQPAAGRRVAAATPATSPRTAAPQAFIYDAAQNYADAGIPLVVLGGKEYGSGSSRDWAAKGTALLGVRAVIVESYERIHRSNLIGMGVLPLQFPDGETAASLGLDGTETFDITGVTALNDGSTPRTVHVTATKEGGENGRVRRGGPHRHPRRGRLLPQRRDHAVRAARACCAADAHRRS